MKIPFVEDRIELLRWALSGVTVVFLHGAVAAAMLNWDEDDAVEADGGDWSSTLRRSR